MKTLFAILILIISFQSRCFAINIVTSLNGGNCSLVTAENNTILNQNESLIVKSLTKTTKTKKIFIREEIDGFRYFLLQDKYIIVDGQVIEGSHPDFNKLKRRTKAETIRAIKYKGDFLITELDDTQRVVDTKGQSTTEFEIKKKLFMFKYPNLKLDVLIYNKKSICCLHRADGCPLLYMIVTSGHPPA